MPKSPAEKTKALIATMAGSGNREIGLDTAAEIAGKGRQFEFTFEYLGFLFAVKASAEEQRTNMFLRAHLGNVPYTAEGPIKRSNAMEVLSAATVHLGGRVKVTSHQRIILIEDYVFDEPLTPVLLLTKAATLLVQAKPFLELLSEVVHPPVQAPAPAQA